MEVIFMGTPDFAVPALESLVAAGHQVKAVVTQPDRPVGRRQILTPPPVKVRALSLGLPVHQPEKIRTPEARAFFEPLFRSVEAVIVAAYGRILPDWMLEAPRYGCLNIHSSLLPRYRGAAPIAWAIACGERETGVTLMQMDAGLDTGPILGQARTAIGPEETAETLTPRLAQLGARLLVELLPKLVAGELPPQPQRAADATLAPILRREDGRVDWQRTAQEILDRQRGFTPFPGCHSFLFGQRIELIGIAPEEPTGETAVPPGTIVATDRESFSVRCGGGTQLRIRSVQPAGKRGMSVRDFLNGVRLTVGDGFDGMEAES